MPVSGRSCFLIYPTQFRMNGVTIDSRDVFVLKGLKKLKEFPSLPFLKAQCELLMSELEEIKTTHKTTAALLGQRTIELDNTLKELKTTRVQVVNVQTEVERLQEELERSQGRLDTAETEKNELESQILCLRQNLANLEEAQVQAAQERDEHRRKEEEMDDRIKKMEQVLEEELEQFENLLKAKDVEVRYMKY